MPTPEQIAESLRQVANDWRFLAIFWHCYFGTLALALLFEYRPSRRTMGVLLALPLLSVSILAWITRNPFNGSVFGLSAISLIVISQRLTSRPVQIGPRWQVVAGACLLVLGWSYPHFLGTAEGFRYLYAAPTGLLPCPTLSIVIGAALILEGLESRSWCLLTGLTGMAYGLFGAVRLGVGIDWILVAGSLTMLLVSAVDAVHERSLRSVTEH
jgi:hypothetical protein